MTQLAEFFTTMESFLAGAMSPSEVEGRLGPSASGVQSLAFYRVLIDRNVRKAMCELYPSLPVLVERHQPGTWRRLVDAYIDAHPPRGRHPDAIGRGFPAFLRARRSRHPEQPVWLEECADLHACQLAAATAQDRLGVIDGLEVTLFVRAYTHAVPRLVADPSHAAPQSFAPRPTLVLVHRSWRDARVQVSSPRPIHLLAIARRQKTPELPMPDGITPALLDEAERWLIHRGALRPGTPC